MSVTRIALLTLHCNHEEQVEVEHTLGRNLATHRTQHCFVQQTS